MSTILEKCNAINAEKQAKIKPENIKKDVEIFGVKGIAESGNCDMLTKIPDELTSYVDVRSYITKMPELDFSNRTNLYYMFENCRNVTSFPELNTSKATVMAGMFFRCESLTSISKLDTSSATSLSYLFKECTSLKSIPPLDTKNATNISGIFHYCYELETIHELNCELVTQVNEAVMACRKLVNFGGLKNIGKAFTTKKANYSYYEINLNPSTLLTHESLMNVINKLYDLNLTYDVANGGTLYTQKLILGSTNLAKLTADEIAIATNKGWAVS